MRKNSKWPDGFTLAELLIALAILGIIATFTIPKVLQSQQDGRYKAIAKEAASAISGAYSAYQLQNTQTATTKAADLLPYMNYVTLDTASSIDLDQTLTTISCSGTAPCAKLHNGAALMATDDCFRGTASTNAVFFILDPDGKVTDGTTNGPGKSLSLVLYSNGRLVSVDGVASSTITDWFCNGNSEAEAANPTYIPTWFSWN
jgi:prepilin-type N-terminal cleavage/methylation domain-containing protein